MATIAKTNDRLDRAGFTASTACAIHCALMPFVITVLPFLGLAWLSSEWVEWALFGSAAVIGFSSMHLGYRRHGDRRAAVVFAVGFASLGIGRWAHEMHWGWRGVAFLVIGGFTIAGSHWLNQRFYHSCPTCCKH